MGKQDLQAEKLAGKHKHSLGENQNVPGFPGYEFGHTGKTIPD